VVIALPVGLHRLAPHEVAHPCRAPLKAPHCGAQLGHVFGQDLEPDGALRAALDGERRGHGDQSARWAAIVAHRAAHHAAVAVERGLGGGEQDRRGHPGLRGIGHRARAAAIGVGEEHRRALGALDLRQHQRHPGAGGLVERLGPAQPAPRAGILHRAALGLRACRAGNAQPVLHQSSTFRIPCRASYSRSTPVRIWCRRLAA